MKIGLKNLVFAAMVVPFFAAADHRKDLDMYQEDGNVVVIMRVPGIPKSHIKISIEQEEKRQVLRVSGENEARQEVSKSNYYRKELAYGSFRRVVSLPCSVDMNNVDAALENGVLTIIMPKTTMMESKVGEMKEISLE